MSTATTTRRTQLFLGVGEIGFATVLLLLAAATVLTAAMRVVDPVHWGLWVSPTMFLMGVVDDPGQAEEVLGARIYAIAPLLLALAYFAGRECWGSARRHLRQALSDSQG